MPRGLIVLIAAASAVVTVIGMRIFSPILGPVLLALTLTMAVQPIQTWAQRRGWHPWVGMVGALVTVYAILIGIAGALVISTGQLASVLPDYAESFNEQLDGLRTVLANAGVDAEQIRNMLSSLDIGKLVDVLSTALQGLLGVFSNLLFVLALLLFTTAGGMTMGKRIAFVTRIRPDIAFALTTAAQGTRNYLVVSTVFGLIVAVLDGGALVLLGIPLPWLWAMLSFITNYIPNIGFLIGVIPPALLALLEGGPILMLWVIVIYSVINFVIQSVIQPKFVGDAVGLSTAVTFLSLVFWASVLGAIGALLAVPLTLLVKALLLDIDPTTRWMNVMISGSVEDTAPTDDTTEPDTAGSDGEAAGPADHPPPPKK
ncbi:AI-2E family transporter [Rhodococcus sp. LB1]|nr:AI-2E family transporter [Rhodococcus sp. LB1]